MIKFCLTPDLLKKPCGEEIKIGLVSNFDQIVTWFVLFFVLYSIVSGKIRYDVSAFGGLLFLNILGVSSISDIFLGFSAPALFTVAIVLVMSAGVVESGVLYGLGRNIAKKISKTRNQIFAVFISTSFISAFMNNVGAIGIIFPTSKRMAQRAGIKKSDFGLPVAYASILGGSVTLIGTASNLIVSTFRLQAFGQPFKMFDFAYHGLAMVAIGFFVVFVCEFCSLGFVKEKSVKQQDEQLNENDDTIEPLSKRSVRKNIIVFITLVLAVVFCGVGIVHPSVGFGTVVVIWLVTGVFSYKTAVLNINIPIIIFLGSMFSLSRILENTGALKDVINYISPFFTSMSSFSLILIFLFVTALFANIIDNSVAALIMSPIAIELSKMGALNVNPDALLMAVAAGASLAIVLPTHQATIVVMSQIEFPQKRFILTGAIITLIAGVFASLIISAVWV